MELKDIVTGEESDCVNCGERIYCVIDPYSGCVDWGSDILGNGQPDDFGCAESPDTDDEGTGSHKPEAGHTPAGFRILIDSKSYWERIEETNVIQHTAETCPGRPCSTDCDHLERIDARS